MAAAPLWAASGGVDKALEQAVAKLQYLTPLAGFRHLKGHGKPPAGQLPPARLRELGLTRDTWRLDVAADPASKAKIKSPTRSLAMSSLRQKR